MIDSDRKKDSDNTDKYRALKLILFIFECFMAFFYVAISIVLLFTPLFIRSIQSGLRIGLGVILGIYGVFRVYQAICKIKQKYE